MITCKECIENMKPLDDPRVRSGIYRRSYCEHYCSKPTYYRELEQIMETRTETIIKYEYVTRRGEATSEPF